jgi:hypothetical protein
VNGRLARLLAYLNKEHPGQGWANYVNGSSGSDLAVRWENIVISGHSQGSGHAAWLAQTTRLRGAMLFSGPQDQEHDDTLDDPNFWINAKIWATKRVTALNHDPEKDSDGTWKSWLRMAEPLGWPKNWSGGSPFHVKQDETPPYGALTSNLPTGFYGAHVSSAYDAAHYAAKIWPGMFSHVCGLDIKQDAVMV